MGPILHLRVAGSQSAEEVAVVLGRGQASLQSVAQRAAEALGESYDAEEHYRILTRRTERGVLPLRNEAELREFARSGSLAELRHGTEIVRACLEALDAMLPGDDAEQRIRDLLATVHADAWLAEEFVVQGGFHSLLVAGIEAEWTSDAVVDLAMACLGVLLALDLPAAWLGEHLEELSPSFFNRVLQVLFPEQSQNLGSDEAEQPLRFASFCCVLLLLRAFPTVVASLHHAACARGHGGVLPIYGRMVRAALAERGDPARAEAAHAMLTAVVAAAEGQEGLSEEVAREVEANTEDSASAALLLNLVDDGQRLEQLLAVSLSACGLQAIAGTSTVFQCHDRGTSEEGPPERCLGFVKHSVADTELQRQPLSWPALVEANSTPLLEEGDVFTARSRQAVLRRAWQAERALEVAVMELQSCQQMLQALVPFVRVDSSLIVEQSLEPLLYHGWENIRWKDGYSLLHHAAEHSDDPRVIALVGTLAGKTNLDTHDDAGKRPADYALLNPCDNVSATLAGMRRAQTTDPLATPDPKAMEHGDGSNPDIVWTSAALRQGISIAAAPTLDFATIRENSSSARHDPELQSTASSVVVIDATAESHAGKDQRLLATLTPEELRAEVRRAWQKADAQAADKKENPPKSRLAQPRGMINPNVTMAWPSPPAWTLSRCRSEEVVRFHRECHSSRGSLHSNSAASRLPFTDSRTTSCARSEFSDSDHSESAQQEGFRPDYQCPVDAVACADHEVVGRRPSVEDLQDRDVWKSLGVDAASREQYLSDDQFESVFGMGKAAFARLPKWRRNQKKSEVSFF